MDWQDAIGVVTGAASGIGWATTRELAGRGASVIAIDLDSPTLHRAVDSWEGVGGGRIMPVVADVADRGAVASGIEGADVPHLDLVVNCAASFVANGLAVSEAEWDLALGVNVRGAANVVQAAHPFLRRSRHPAVVNTSSISAHIAQPSRWTYNTTKAAIIELTRCMAMDLAPDGIRVNAVSPGWIWTPEVSAAADGDRERWEPVWGDYHLLRRLGEPEEVAAAILFLCSPKASFITGTELMVDGGYSAMGPEGLGERSTFAGASNGAAR